MKNTDSEANRACFGARRTEKRTALSLSLLAILGGSTLSFQASAAVLYAHYDASIAGSVTLVNTNQVTAWADQSGNGFGATPAFGTVLYPSPTGLNNGMNMGATKNTLSTLTAAQQDALLDFTSPGGAAEANSGFSFFVVIKVNSLLGGIARDVVLSNRADITNGLLLRLQEGPPELYLDGKLLENTVTPAVGDTLVIAANYDKATGLLELWDSKAGSTVTTTVAAGDFSEGAAITLGGTANPDQNLNGHIGEVKFYQGKLSSAEFAAERLALTAKWIGDPTLAGTQIWDGGGTNNQWSNKNNWEGPNGGSYPNFKQSLTFAGNVQNTSSNNLPVPASNYNDIGGMIFRNDGSAGKTNAFNIVGNDLALGGVDIITKANVAGTTITDDIQVDVILDAPLNIVTNQQSGTVQHNLLISGDISGAGGLNKLGAATLILTGSNTYTGNTTVNAGTLELADNAQLTFVLGATAGVNNSLTGDGTATLNGDFVINTLAADVLPTGSWTLENVSNLTDDEYGSSFTVVGFTDAGGDKWTKDNGATIYTFDEATGILTLAATSGGFSSWINQPFAGGATAASPMPLSNPPISASMISGMRSKVTTT